MYIFTQVHAVLGSLISYWEKLGNSHWLVRMTVPWQILTALGCTGIIARAEKRCESNSGIKSVPHNFCPLNSGVCLVVAYLEAKTAFSMLLKTTLVYSPVSLSYLHELPRNTRVVGGQCWAQQSAHTGQAILLGISWFCQKLISST